MERKLPGNFFRKFGYTSRGCPRFWKCRKIVITGAVNRKMLFHSLLEVAGKFKTEVLVEWKALIVYRRAPRQFQVEQPTNIAWARFKRRISHVPNLIPIWVDSNY